MREVGVILNGVTGRMGMNQHLLRSIVAIREQGGIELDSGARIWPEPVLVGRRPERLRELAAASGVETWTTDLDEVLADPAYEVYFDALLTSARPDAVRAAIAAGKHVYCEKPIAPDLETALELLGLAREAGVKHGVVQDKLFLPGLLKLADLVRDGFFGRILSVRGEFGYWVFPGPEPPAQRPSWNYRREDGGGVIVDMFCHWRYVLDNLFGPVRTVTALGATHMPTRYDEQGDPYDATAEDAAYAQFELDGGVVVQLNSSWCTRVDRDELLELHVDGTDGSAVAGSARLPHPGRRSDSHGGLESGPPRSGRRSASRGARSRTPAVRERVQGTVGALPPPRGRRRTVPVGFRRGGQGHPARRARHPILGGAPHPRSAGDRAVSVATRTPLTLPGADGSLTSWSPGPAPGAARSRTIGRSANPRVLRRRTRGGRPVGAGDPGSAPPSTGKRRWPTDATSGLTASASPTRWTPRSGAARSAGLSPGS